MKKYWIFLLFSGFFAQSFAQGDYEAYRFSQIDYMGTARYLGAGGTFGTVGGDFSGLSTNPAAIGLYKRHEVSFTPMMLSFFKDNTTYNGNSNYTQNPKYTVPQCGLVIATSIDNSDWKAWQFGFGYNRIMDYNNTFRVDGTPNTSFINPILANANGTSYNQLVGDQMLAWNTWLIDTFPGQTSRYFSPFSDANLNQTAVIKQSGAIDEMSFTFGGNYNDKLYLGASLAIPFLDYTEQTILTETPSDEDHLMGITSYKVRTTQRDRGAGINAKIGVIYQPVNFLRLSAGIQTPTYFWKIKDYYNREMTSYWIAGYDNQQHEYTYNYQFALSTPFRFNVGTAFLINKRGFISAEYEFNDYRMATLYANDYNFSDENDMIRAKYGICHSVRIGGEVNLTPKFALRAGYNFKSSPYLNSSEWSEGFNGSAHYGSVGFGYRSKFLFVDLAYVLKFSKDSYNLYPDATAQIKNTTHRVAATIGFKF